MIVETNFPSGNKRKVFVGMDLSGEPCFVHIEAWNILREEPEYVQAVGTNYMLSISRSIGKPILSWQDRIKAAWNILRGQYTLLDTIDLDEKEALELRDYITMTHGGD